MKKLLLCGVAALALTACGKKAETTPPETEVKVSEKTIAAPRPELGSFGLDKSTMNEAITPGDDFYKYMNGTWLDNFEIPAEFSNYGSFTVLFERSEERVKSIIEAAADKRNEAGSPEQKVGDYYASFLDTDKIDQTGMAAAAKDIAYIAQIASTEDVVRAFGSPALGASSPIAGYVDIDSKNPEAYIFYLTQSGLGMPNRDYYLKENFADARDAYKIYLGKLLTIAGKDNVESRVAAIFELETKIADIHWEPAKRRQRDLTYNPYTLDELKHNMPKFPWDAMLDEAGLSGQSKFVLREHDAIEQLAGLVTTTDLSLWQDYLLAHYLSEHSAVLSTDLDIASFEFFGTALSGTTEQRERWKRGVAAVNGALGEAVGQVYTEQHFPTDSKVKMEELVGNLKATFEQRLDGLDWMSEETQVEAHKKLAAFTTKIGYPDEWKDYSDLQIIRGDAFGNSKRSNVWEWTQMISKLGQPIDRNEWFMTPQTVNAYYSPTRNEIVFPAAILQAPFFDPNADAAINYGAIGAVIGHEIGHGFDDQGRKSDGTGLLRDWWTKEDTKRFQVKADKLGAQYAKFSPVEGMYLNPELTMGENIGDLGGLTMAYDAYKLSLNGAKAPVIDGLTGDQRFFMAWAQVWKRKYREEELKKRIATDPHSPSEYRTNGIVRNMDAWYTAFDVKEGDALYLAPEDRVKIW